jgi:predicted regulator of Ras-like GTPase activity (Roadblock/LC7/MglB family)
MFSEHLKAIMDGVDGAIACSVMGFDGISVETLPKEMPEAVLNLDLQSAWVEFANLLSQAKATAETLKTGKVSELSINSEKVITLLRMVNQDYFLVVGLLPTANYGKARYVLRITAPKVAKDL